MTRETPLLAVARGDRPADLLLTNAQVVNVFDGRVQPGAVAISGDTIAGVGQFYSRGEQIIDLGGRFLFPGLIDGHIHLESSLLTPREFARLAVPRGTTGLVADPHEIANVHGLAGIRWLAEAGRDLPLEVLLTAPSCVPATSLETAGAQIGPLEVQELLSWPQVVGLGELMNFPGAVAGDPELLEKVGLAHRAGKTVDGHAPGLTGPGLNAYLSLGACSDHECTTAQEAAEKLRLGMWLMIREGSAASNLEALLPVVNAETCHRCLLVSDDRHPADLFGQGHLDYLLRRATELGIDPVWAVRMVTLNPAHRFGLRRRGAVAPGYQADLVAVEDLKCFHVTHVVKNGRLVAQDGRLLEGLPASPEPPPGGMKVPGLEESIFRLTAPGKRALAIGLVPGEILTRRLEVQAPEHDGYLAADPGRDLTKLAVIERHRGTGRIGIGLVHGLGLRRGALAGSVAHDSHNLVVVGASDREMLTAAEEVVRMGGGLAVAAGEKVLASLPLPVAGLMSDLPAEQVLDRLAQIDRAVRELGCQVESPFFALSFLALPVIPELRLTDLGMVDVAGQHHVPGYHKVAIKR